MPITCGTNLLPNHHLQLKAENRADLRTWEEFLKHSAAYSRTFTDFNKVIWAKDVLFYSDTSKNKFLGAGGYCNKDWYIIQWDSNFLEQFDPSISYLELYAVTVAVVLWLERFKNSRIAIFCDNIGVVNMINNNSSKCKNCMVLIRIIVLKSLIHNVRLSAKYVPSKQNSISDSLSRLDFPRFLHLTKGKFSNEPTRVPTGIMAYG